MRLRVLRFVPIARDSEWVTFGTNDQLFTGEHYHAQKKAIYLYLYLIDRCELGTGLIEHYEHRQAAAAMKINLRTVHLWFGRLVRGGYVEVIRPDPVPGQKVAIPEALRWQVFHRDGYRCQSCGATGVPLQADHVVPESKGGPTTADNLQTLCGPCNRRKGDRA